nr:TIGR03086 family metal-binding protein [Nocardia bovistercoris]
MLVRAIDYTLVNVAAVRRADLDSATPCAHWNLRTLLDHLNDSLDALCAAARPSTGTEPPAADPVLAFGARAARVRALWPEIDHDSPVRLGGRTRRADVLAHVAAVEIAVHGWDVARACAANRPIPDELARAILTFIELIVPETGRPPQFHPPVAMPDSAPADERLLAYLGRYPG